MSEMDDWGDPTLRRRVGRRRGDALAAVLDAVGLARARRAPSSTPTATGSRRPSTTTATAPASTSSARSPTPRATAAATARFAHHLGLEHMAFHGVQGRGVLVDLAHHLGHDWRGVDRDDARGDHGGRRRRRRAGRHAAAAHRLRHEGPRVEPRPGPGGDPHDVHLPRRARRVAARVDRRVADLGAGGRQLRGRRAASARTATRAGTRSSRSTTSACSSSASRSGRCGTCTSSRPGCASTTGAGSCSPRRRCGCPASVGSPVTPVATV